MNPRGEASGRAAWTVETFHRALRDNLYYVRGASIQSASPRDLYAALAYTVRDYLIDRWRRTADAHYRANPKFVYYLSAEYLPGKQLLKNLLYSSTLDLARQAFAQTDLSLEELIALEAEPGLGNGGLGRLASCFLDSMATLDLPSVGYGLRYEYGIFTQTFEDGWQVESPDQWLFYGNP
ncbi:MAG: glycogen/starch/alpha-glucan phosphorylase, partial [Anaerolineae bacterium]|nr:glycogen/starch/alpha-glucan phosphorylase [Anaerolineae bacterium]